VNFASGQTFPGAGTVTSVGSGAGLTGGPITTSGTLSIATGGVSNAMLANPSLTISPGTDLTGGGLVALGGSTTLNLDTTKVPQLAAANTFTGAQTIYNNVTITAANTTVTASGGNTGLSGSGSNIGVYGTGSNYGVYGNGPIGVVGAGDTGGYGVFGAGGAYSVYGANGLSEGGVGVYGISSGSDGYSVYGGPTGANGWAGYFAGNVNVTGNLSKGGGSFKIDHPLDPANKYLYHSFVESPDMMNIYNGNVILDKDGTAWITLPDYFGVLNRDFRYQLTAVGAPGPNLYIAQKITNNRFQIAGGTPGGEVSWQVTGIRQDDFAKAHPIIPEVEKTGEERGKYLHPVEHGLPKSMGIDESRRAKMLAQHPEPPKPREQVALPELPKLEPSMLLQQPPLLATPRTKSPVPQPHVAVPEPQK